MSMSKVKKSEISKVMSHLGKRSAKKRGRSFDYVGLAKKGKGVSRKKKTVK